MTDKEKTAWEKWNKELRPPRLTAEQSLEWLDGMRALMFEVWKKNPKLRARYIKTKNGGH